MGAAYARAALSCGAKRFPSMPVGDAGCYPVICFRLYLTVVAIDQEFFYKFSVNLNEHKEMACRVFNPGFRKSSLAVHGVRFKGVRTISRGKCGMPPREARFGADLLSNCPQTKNFCQHAWDKNFQRSCRNRWKKTKKNPAPSNESAGILGAASRNRTGTGLRPGDFKSWKSFTVICYYLL